MRIASPSMAATAPPSYPQSNRANPGVSSHGGAGVAPVPHFDSILRAAPAFDGDDFEDDELSNSPSSSTSSLPDQVNSSDGTRFTTFLRPHIEQHTSLHAYLDANSMLEEFIIQTRERLHLDAGKVKSTLSKVKFLESNLNALQLEGEKKGKMFWSPKKKRDWRHRMEKTRLELDPTKAALHESERSLQEDREKLHSLEAELIEYKKVEARLDAIDDEIFRGVTHGHDAEDMLEQSYHILTQTQRRLLSAVQLEIRAQTYLNKSLLLCTALIKELLVGLNIGIDIGVPTNTKHKTGLWRGTSTIFSAKAARNHVLRAKTLVGDLHTNYLLARAAQRRVAILTRVQVIELNRLPGMNAKNVVDEAGLHRSLEQSYAQAKMAKSHIEGQQKQSKGRQAGIKKRIKELQKEARMVWIELRQKRREIVQENKQTNDHERPVGGHLQDESALPPYKRNLVSTSVVGLSSAADDTQRSNGNVISLPLAFRRRVDRESIAKSKEIIRQVAIEEGGLVEEDNVDDDELLQEEEDIPGFELSFR